jgi:hypothetical protein
MLRIRSKRGFDVRRLTLDVVSQGDLPANLTSNVKRHTSNQASLEGARISETSS